MSPHQELGIQDYCVVNRSPADTVLARQGSVTEQYLEGAQILHGKCLYSFIRPHSEMSPSREGKPWIGRGGKKQTSCLDFKKATGSSACS